MKVLIKQFEKKGKLPETTLRTRRNSTFCKDEKSVIFGILAKGGPHENFLESSNFRNGWK